MTSRPRSRGPARRRPPVLAGLGSCPPVRIRTEVAAYLSAAREP